MDREKIEQALLEEYRRQDIETKRREELWKQVNWHPNETLLQHGLKDNDVSIREQVWTNPHWQPTQEHFNIGKEDKAEIIKEHVFSRELHSLEERYDALIDSLKSRQDQYAQTLEEMRKEREERQKRIM